MIPKEKADELVTKYRRFLPMNLTTMLDAKGCALIAANEIKEQLLQNLDNEVSTIHAIYWEKVKQEIRKL